MVSIPATVHYIKDNMTVIDDLNILLGDIPAIYTDKYEPFGVL